VTLRIVVAPAAQSQLAELAGWWSTHRPASTTTVQDELVRVVELPAEMPHLGRPYRRRSARNVRHFPLSGTPYHVFYAVVAASDELRVLAVWSGLRGEGPRLGRR
jgi:plasmid stabilization system protein ParE